MRQLCQRPHIEIDHSELRLDRLGREPARMAEARIVDQHIDAEPALCNLRRQLRAAANLAEIARDRRDLSRKALRKSQPDVLSTT